MSITTDIIKARREGNYQEAIKLEQQEEREKLIDAIDNISIDSVREFTKLINEYSSLERAIKYYQKEKEELLDEHYKDNKIQEMQKKYNEMRCDLNRGFPISEEESKAIRQWMDNHEKEHSGRHGCCGGKYTYVFIPTSLGTIGTIKCFCGESFDFQEL